MLKQAPSGGVLAPHAVALLLQQVGDFLCLNPSQNGPKAEQTLWPQKLYQQSSILWSRAVCVPRQVPPPLPHCHPLRHPFGDISVLLGCKHLLLCCVVLCCSRYAG